MSKDRQHDDDNAVRLDKWLWAARFYKTRALAREMIDGGKVHYNGQRSKPGKLVELDAEITLRQGNDTRTVMVRAITDQRRPAAQAQALYEETPQSIEKTRKAGPSQKIECTDNAAPGPTAG
ncbi:hypothetical protein DZS_22380 [Dickeya ananatis]